MAFYSPEDVAAVLKCKSSTLRKYALLLQNYGYTFQKNSQGHRWYSDTDVTVLKRAVTLKNSTAMNLEDCMEAAFLWSKSSDVAPIVTEQKASQDVMKYEGTITPDDLYNALQEQQRTVERMADMIDQQAQHNALMMDELTATRTAMQRLDELLSRQPMLPDPNEFPDAVEKDKRSLWARIFNKRK